MKNKLLNEILDLTLQEMERNPGQLVDMLPSLDVTDDGYAYIDVPAYENGQYGTTKKKIKFDPENIIQPGDKDYNDPSWDISDRIPEGWTVEDTGEGPSLEGYMLATLGLPKPPTKRPKPQGF